MVYTESKLVCLPPKQRFQTNWLQDPKFVEFLGKQIDSYFKINTTQTSASVRWEAFKAFIRGQIISYTSAKTQRAK